LGRGVFRPRKGEFISGAGKTRVFSETRGRSVRDAGSPKADIIVKATREARTGRKKKEKAY